MNYTLENNKNENTDRTKSAIITLLISALVFLLLFFYSFTRIPQAEPEAVTTMLINFGDNQTGNMVEEPANQEGSMAVMETVIPFSGINCS